MSSALRGVNLGGWLVLEKWITPSLFEGTNAVDEYTFSAGGEAAQQKLRAHRDTFITEADFAWLQAKGIQAVRLPIGYWVFGDAAPYVWTVEYVDRAFGWAAKHNIKILLDLHAAPGSQNGRDHSGRLGAVGWAKDEANIILTLEVIKRLAIRYCKDPQLLGISLLNEPQSRMSKSVLTRYYQAAYAIIRDKCGPDVWVVFSDGFRPRRWRNVLHSARFQNVFIDTHHYQCFSWWDKHHSIGWHLKKAAGAVPRSLAKMSLDHPVIVGEWSLALTPARTGYLSPEQVDELNRAYGAAQLLAYDQAKAWFFWTYRSDGSPTWSYRDCVGRDWLPTEPPETGNNLKTSSS